MQDSPNGRQGRRRSPEEQAYNMLQPLRTITANTFIESIRQPIFTVLLVVGGLGMVLMPSLTAYSMDEDIRLLMELSISWLYVVSVLLAAFTATSVLSREIENRTVLTVLTKPVPRPVFVLGKFLGVTGAILMAMWALAMLMLMVIRNGVMTTASDTLDRPVLLFGVLAVLTALVVGAAMNYLYHKPFTSRFVAILTGGLTVGLLLLLIIDRNFGFQSPAAEFTHGGMMHGGQMPAAIALVALSVLFLTAVAIAASTRLSQAATMTVTLLVVGMGLTGRGVLLGGAIEPGTWQDQASRFLPDLLLLWPGEALVQDKTITGGFVLAAAGYALALTVAGVLLAVALFQRRELG